MAFEALLGIIGQGRSSIVPDHSTHGKGWWENILIINITKGAIYWVGSFFKGTADSVMTSNLAPVVGPHWVPHLLHFHLRLPSQPSSGPKLPPGASIA